ncbi:MAG: hypothetical protein U0175_30070 [Caldilineaceae bacterium]
MTNLKTTPTASGIYRSYLVRFWQSNEHGNWRASAQCVQTANTVMFGDIASLFVFLQCEVEGQATKDEITPVHNLTQRLPGQ